MLAQPSSASMHVFMIADVRGYTRFTVERGDVAAATLAMRFAEAAREVVAHHDGTVPELRGDEALAVFASVRQALRAALALQDRCRDRHATACLWSASCPPRPIH